MQAEYTSTLGIIAGMGALPLEIINACQHIGRNFFIISIEGKVEDHIYNNYPHTYLNIGSVGKIIKTLKEKNIAELVLAGKVTRPKLSALQLDLMGVRLMSRLSSAKSGGDITVFDIIINFLQEKGFVVQGVSDIAPELLTPDGVLGKVKPDKIAKKDIELGFNVAKAIGEADIGQAIIVQQKLVLGVEAVEGTDALIERCKNLKLEGKGGVLVKVKKPGQDPRVDLPTIGLTTLQNAHKSGLRGIAIEAENSLIVNRKAVIKKANELGLFIFGIGESSN